MDELHQGGFMTSEDGGEVYLLAQDTMQMKDCLSPTAPPILHTLASIQDRLGWDNFVGGRISTVFMAAVKPQLSSGKYKRSPEKWSATLSKKLLELTHKQWLFRNSHVHYEKSEGLTTHEHEEIFDKVKQLLWTDPAELLGKHKYLLEEDFHQLGEGSSGARQVWIGSMESALRAASFVKAGNQLRGNPGIHIPADAYLNVIRPSSAGRLVYQRRRMRARM